MLTDTYNQKGEKTGQTRLPAEIFNVKINSGLVHQVAVSLSANKRKVIAHTKTKGKVRGGGKKPWRQKGTGRARASSIRSPIWRGGGVTFGPTKERVFKKKINKKMRRSALFMVLSAKAKDNLILILDKLSLEAPKSKLMRGVLDNLKMKDSSLILLPKAEKNIALAARNLQGVRAAEARNINVLDLLSFKHLIIPKDALKTIKETFVK